MTHLKAIITFFIFFCMAWLFVSKNDKCLSYALYGMWVITCFYTKDGWGKLWRFKNDLLSCPMNGMLEAFTGAFKIQQSLIW